MTFSLAEEDKVRNTSDADKEGKDNLTKRMHKNLIAQT